MTRRIVLASVLGLVAGAFIDILIVVIASAWAFVANSSVEIPGIYSVRAEDPSGLRGLDFAFNVYGLLIVVAAAMLVFALGAAYLGRGSRSAGSR